jgi:predicted transcriptional regulator
MAHEQLTAAAKAVRSAAATATDDAVRERLEDQAEALSGLAERDPDHGRMARHEEVLRNVADEAGKEVADHCYEALDDIIAYRETIEGV